MGIGITASTTQVYQAKVQLFVATSTTDNATQLAQGNTFTQNRVQSYTSVATSPDVTNPVIKNLGLDLTPSELADKISATAPLNKVLIDLKVTDHDPGTAAKLANAVAAEFSSVVENKIEQTGADGKPVVKLTVIHPATAPDAPIKPNKLLNIGLGVVLSLLVGVGVVVLRDVLDNTVKGPQDFEEIGIPVLGLIPFDKRTAKTPIAFRGDPHSTRSEAYRQLRTNMQFVNVDKAPRVIAVTSAVPGEGKTTTSINFAAALAEAGFRVCLIEADLRRPTIAKTLGLVGDAGFTTALIGQAPVEAVLQNAGRNLAVLTSGPVPPNPSELLITDQAKAIIAHVAEQVDFTVIDTAPLLPVADGAEVAALADATLVVHHAGKSTKEQALHSIERLEQVGERPVGVVLNMITRSRGNYDYNYGYYYSYRPQRSRGLRRITQAQGDEATARRGAPGAAAYPAAPARDDARRTRPAGANEPLPSAPPSDEDLYGNDPFILDSFIDDTAEQPGRHGHPVQPDITFHAPPTNGGARTVPAEARVEQTAPIRMPGQPRP